MAYETSTASDLADLVQKLFTFAVANGWTQDRLDFVNGEAALHRNNVYWSMRWIVATPLTLSHHQALGYTGGNDGGDHPDDSGNGYNDATTKTNALLDNERSVPDLGDGPFNYHFFESDVYLHCAVEISSGVWRHFGAGTLTKRGDWTGGEYVYGHVHVSGNLTSTTNTTLMDGLFNSTTDAVKRQAATLHVEGLPGEAGSSKWGNIWGNKSFTTAEPTDDAGNAKVTIQGGYKAGPIAQHFGFLPAGSTSGLVPMYQFALFYLEAASTRAYLLGYMPDVRGVNIANFAAAQEVSIGSDTWVVFPDSQKSTSGTNASFNRGVAYKKVTT